MNERLIEYEGNAKQQENEEEPYVPLADTVVYVVAVVIEIDHTSVAYIAVLGPTVLKDLVSSLCSLCKHRLSSCPLPAYRGPLGFSALACNQDQPW